MIFLLSGKIWITYRGQKEEKAGVSWAMKTKKSNQVEPTQYRGMVM